MNTEQNKSWTNEIRQKTDKEIENMVDRVSPFSSVTDKRIDFALVELQRRVSVKNVKAVRELNNTVKKSNKVNEKYSKRLLVYTIVLVIIGILTIIVQYTNGR